MRASIATTRQRLVGIIAIAMLVSGATAYAQSGSDLFTACLSHTGSLYNVALGTYPDSCKPGDQ